MTIVCGAARPHRVCALHVRMVRRRSSTCNEEDAGAVTEKIVIANACRGYCAWRRWGQLELLKRATGRARCCASGG